jgi:hypothetical protein
LATDETYLRSLANDMEREGSVTTAHRLRQIADRSRDYYKRIDELLEANNRYLEDARLARAFGRQLLEAVQANHKWHQDYDDVDGYPGSELETINLRAMDLQQVVVETFTFTLGEGVVINDGIMDRRPAIYLAHAISSEALVEERRHPLRSAATIVLPNWDAADALLKSVIGASEKAKDAAEHPERWVA